MAENLQQGLGDRVCRIRCEDPGPADGRAGDQVALFEKANLAMECRWGRPELAGECGQRPVSLWLKKDGGKQLRLESTSEQRDR